MKTQIKICGLTSEASIDTAVDAGATHIGFVHFAKSPRHISLDRAAELREYARGRIKTVLLLVNEEPATTGRAVQIVRPDIVQFHGAESPDWLHSFKQANDIEIWKAMGVKDAETLANSSQFIGAVDRLLFDAPAGTLPGGTGTRFDWSLLSQFDHRMPWGLAGGLTPDNVADAIRATGATLVDTSSGVESAPGIKDVAKIAAFCKAVRDN